MVAQTAVRQIYGLLCPQAKGSLSLSGFHVYFVCKYGIPEALGLLGEGIKDP